MVVEKFTQNFLNSGLLRLYVATGFFMVMIFFVLNSNAYTPMSMMLGIVASAILFKGIANIMLSLIVSYLSLDNIRQRLEFKHNSNRIDEIMTELIMSDADEEKKEEKKE